jgi:glutathione synthase/RimK-type ligase-like ATP-grasp enzyme
MGPSLSLPAAGPIVCLYGATAAVFVEPVVADLQEAAARRRREIVALSIETALAAPLRWRNAARVYVLPFDLPPAVPEEPASSSARLLRSLFPKAEFLNAPATHELCWDKIATAERLLDRGVPMPATMITHRPDEARRFVLEHGHAVLKEPRSCGGHGHLVTFADEHGTIVGEAFGRRYAVEFEASGTGRRLEHGVLACPPPFYLQRLVAEVGHGGVLQPAQIVRAYVVDGRAVFWTERYRPRLRRPSDFIINVAFGARYRFLPEVGEAARTLALRAAEVLGVRIGAVDLIRSGSEGPYVLEVDTDGHHMLIDRSFKALPEFRSTYDLDDYIAEALLAPAPEPLRKRINSR